MCIYLLFPLIASEQGSMGTCVCGIENMLGYTSGGGKRVALHKAIYGHVASCTEQGQSLLF